MRFSSFFAVLLCATLAACEQPSHEPVNTDDGGKGATVTTPVKKPVAPEPEHFDRVRDEQLEKEEDRLRQGKRHY
jgi:hypothetical protein